MIIINLVNYYIIKLNNIFFNYLIILLFNLIYENLKLINQIIFILNNFSINSNNKLKNIKLFNKLNFLTNNLIL